MKEKLLLKCSLSAGDIVMLTAAVRDLHLHYPGRFETSVLTTCSEIWENNPYITPYRKNDRDSRGIECAYPLINQCNERPYHCLHGFIQFLNEELDLAIEPTAFKGDIHLSSQEKSWYSQVHEFAREDIPFWVVAAGGKYDITIKWWDVERYQAVVDHFADQIQFVQIGRFGHHHPRLENALDLRGRTNLRELIRLIYHSEGVLCSVTAVMHLAAAVESKVHGVERACVVVAGAREPAHWEAYPAHQFIHNNGALPCATQGGCWKSRSVKLRDGDFRDKVSERCSNLVGQLPRCMDLITPAMVTERIETFFKGGRLRYLDKRQALAAQRAVALAKENRNYDEQPLNLQSAGLACEQFIKTLPSVSINNGERGIVICGGGVQYFTNAWVCIKMLRFFGCSLPIQLWHIGGREMTEEMRQLVDPLGVECVDALKIRKRSPIRVMSGWVLKAYALLHSCFQEVLLLDADNVPLCDPSVLFDSPQFVETGALFWPDYPSPHRAKADPIWRSCGLRQPDEPEFESGQIALDKSRVWQALRLALWFNENADFYYKHIYGDKETFHLAFRKLKQDYSLVPYPIDRLEKTMCQHDFQGNRIFQHRNRAKWRLIGTNERIKGFRLEGKCREFLAELRSAWSGVIK